ncbi:hypothetical protein H5410_019825 [Solanum commersonii]|uniref:Uncharacterized protein n=1 Tax=Solanum commersonii TaxID=4109 RepID=A0A9J5Z9F4_SOLCO|nr:hypothetical protein H5410_019825 [Solanum commersonii]
MTRRIQAPPPPPPLPLFRGLAEDRERLERDLKRMTRFLRTFDFHHSLQKSRGVNGVLALLDCFGPRVELQAHLDCAHEICLNKQEENKRYMLSEVDILKELTSKFTRSEIP